MPHMKPTEINRIRSQEYHVTYIKKNHMKKGREYILNHAIMILVCN